MTITKAELADHLCAKLTLQKHDAKDLIEILFAEMKAALERGEEVKISGFGNFTTRKKKARPGRNPKTGEDVDISARRVVTFHAGMKLRQIVEDKREELLENYNPDANSE